MKLSELLTGLPVVFLSPEDPIIKGITSDSRSVQEGYLFIAEVGLTVDGHRFVQKAKEQGAAAVLVQREVPENICQVRTPNTSLMMGILASRFYERPSEKMRMIGITGTKGKTTTAFLTHYLLSLSGKSVGLLSSVRFQVGDVIEASHYTTQPAIPLQMKLKFSADSGASVMVMEVSSHALKQRRVANIDYDVAVFTNLSHDHLDFHHTMDEYADAKSMLFSRLGNSDRTSKGFKYAVINGDDVASAKMISQCGVPVFTYGCGSDNLIKAEQIELFPEGSRFCLSWPQGETLVQLPLPGRFNIYNFMAAFCVAWLEGVDCKTILEQITHFPGVPGRFQQVQCGQPYQIIIDYAHTEESLRQALSTAREFTPGKLKVLFGCTGDRDRSKRPRMGEIAVSLADEVVVTSDDPHSEDPESIINEIRNGIPLQTKNVQYVVDRREAIEILLSSAMEGDTLLIAGKGHEQVQIFKDYQVPFSDETVVREFFQKSVHKE